MPDFGTTAQLEGGHHVNVVPKGFSCDMMESTRIERVGPDQGKKAIRWLCSGRLRKGSSAELLLAAQ